MDGPNVNWNVLDGLDEQLIENGHIKTINIGNLLFMVVFKMDFAKQTGTQIKY